MRRGFGPGRAEHSRGARRLLRKWKSGIPRNQDNQYPTGVGISFKLRWHRGFSKSALITQVCLCCEGGFCFSEPASRLRPKLRNVIPRFGAGMQLKRPARSFWSFHLHIETKLREATVPDKSKERTLADLISHRGPWPSDNNAVPDQKLDQSLPANSPTTNGKEPDPPARSIADTEKDVGYW